MVTETTKTKRLAYLLDALTETRDDCANDETERAKFNDVIRRVREMMDAERTAGLHILSVYPVVNGCSREAVFEGTMAQCRAYVHRRKEAEPRFECIIL